MTKEQGRLRLDQIKRIVDRIDYLDWMIHIEPVNEDPEGPIYLQVSFDAWDEASGKFQLQYGRKWLVSRYSTTSEIVQTALKAVLAAQEHEVREGFRYKGKAIFGPHFDVDDLAYRMPMSDLRWLPPGWRLEQFPRELDKTKARPDAHTKNRNRWHRFFLMIERIRGSRHG